MQKVLCFLLSLKIFYEYYLLDNILIQYALFFKDLRVKQEPSVRSSVDEAPQNSVPSPYKDHLSEKTPEILSPRMWNSGKLSGLKGHATGSSIDGMYWAS